MAVKERALNTTSGTLDSVRVSNTAVDRIETEVLEVRLSGANASDYFFRDSFPENFVCQRTS